MTNDSLIGQKFNDLAYQTLLQVEFSNTYTGELNPERVRIRIVQRNQRFYAVEEISEHNFGTLTNGRFNAQWRIEGKKLIAALPQTATEQLVTEIYDFELLELQVGEKTYTDFRLIQ